ncbi:hypothetical protein GJ496_000919 [Pomphorhynchus laevis]|nr:hypothetical protein GJ496_000919 [Pomphorhynchus laevis]
MDFAGPHNGKYYLIVQYALTKWPEVIPVTTITATIVVNKLRTLFARWGVSAVVVSDNGPVFSSDAFRQFLQTMALIIYEEDYLLCGTGLNQINIQLLIVLKSVRNHDQKSPPRSFVAQNLVWYCRNRGQRWEAVEVIKRTSANLYEIRTRDGDTSRSQPLTENTQEKFTEGSPQRDRNGFEETTNNKSRFVVQPAIVRRSSRIRRRPKSGTLIDPDNVRSNAHTKQWLY